MFRRLTEYWEDRGFEILFGISILFIIIYALFRLGKKGTYSNTYFYPYGGSNVNIRGNNSNSSSKPKDSKGEVICRNYLERITRRRFAKARPDFLRNPVTGGDFNLELDCFNPELRLALEYNGVQHYKYVPYFHKNKEAFLNQKYRDEMKRTKCRENGIKLIEVPYSVKHDDLESYVHKKLVNFGFKI